MNAANKFNVGINVLVFVIALADLVYLVVAVESHTMTQQAAIFVSITGVLLAAVGGLWSCVYRRHLARVQIQEKIAARLRHIVAHA